MDAHEVRRKNLMALIAEHGGQKALAERVRPTAPGYISQMVNGTRNVGGVIARRFEKHLGKPHGWMDQCHEEATQNVQIVEKEALSPKNQHPIDPQLVERVVEVVNVYNSLLDAGEQLDEIEKTSLIMDVYFQVKDGKETRITTEMIDESKNRLKIAVGL